MFMNISIDGKWVELGSGATVLPGTYKVTMLSNCIVSDSSGLAGSLEQAGLAHRGQAEVPDSFTATAGDTVTYFWSPGERIVNSNTGGIAHCTGFGHTVTRTNAR
jgi:plastocyanin